MENHIEILNNLICEAVTHGGDAGGPYYSNTKGIVDAIDKYLEFFKLDNDFIVKTKLPPDEDGYCFNVMPYVVKRTEIKYDF